MILKFVMPKDKPVNRRRSRGNDGGTAEVGAENDAEKC